MTDREVPEQSGVTRRDTLKLVAAVASLGVALGYRPASSIAQGKEEGKSEGKGAAKAEGKAAAKGEGKAAGKGKGAAKGEGKGAAKSEGKAEGKDSK